MFAGLTFGSCIVAVFVLWFFRGTLLSLSRTAEGVINRTSAGVNQYTATYAAKLVDDAIIDAKPSLDRIRAHKQAGGKLPSEELDEILGL